jgi:hypothetical protein
LHDSRSGTLRLVGADEAPSEAPVARPLRREPAARRSHPTPSAWSAVIRENQSAAALEIEDARLVFALRVSERLEGGRAAILRPEARHRLMELSSRMGLEPFDASLVIAIVQDAARRGEDAEDPHTRGRLSLVRPSRAERAAEGLLLPIATALALAMIILTVLVGWALGV